MDEKRTLLIQTLAATVVINAILLAIIIVTLGEAAQNQLLLIMAVGLVMTLVLWFVIQTLGGRLLDQVAQRTLAAAPKAEPVAKAQPTPKAAPVQETPKLDPAPLLAQGAQNGAIQMLAILQRQGRLIDFLQEDLSAFADDQIGAAVRNIHEGCKQALDQHVKLEPIYEEAEGSHITVVAGFDPEAVRLSGNVVGEPPFHGELRHRGWRVATIDLPKRMNEEKALPVVAAAEVEV